MTIINEQISTTTHANSTAAKHPIFHTLTAEAQLLVIFILTISASKASPEFLEEYSKACLRTYPANTLQTIKDAIQEITKEP